jgi:hypothetical protein
MFLAIRSRPKLVEVAIFAFFDPALANRLVDVVPCARALAADLGPVYLQSQVLLP